MKIAIPAKTFLIGEYAVIHQAPGIILTTNPCFELVFNTNQAFSLSGIHPQSPAGLWLSAQPPINASFHFHDPYHAQGGLGASSAQFIAVYKAYHHLVNKTWSKQALLDDYYRMAWNGQGLRPSGYDVWAQLHHACVYHDTQTTQCYDWPFDTIDFILLRTGKKLATHLHLQQTIQTIHLDKLTQLSLSAKKAFEQQKANLLIQAVNDYHKLLNQQQLCAHHSQQIIEQCTQHPSVLAAKGCGAMGADIVLLLINSIQKQAFIEWYKNKPWPIVATSNSLNRQG